MESLNNPRDHTARIKGQDFIVKFGKSRLTFSNQLWLEATVAITQRLNPISSASPLKCLLPTDEMLFYKNSRVSKNKLLHFLVFERAT